MLINKKAPYFAADAVVNGKIQNFCLQDLGGRYKVLFFYPLNFTFVCPTEMHALQAMQDQFLAHDVQVVALSVDSAHSHHAWLSTPKTSGGIEGITYPMVSDLTKEIARSYGVLDEEKGIAYRGTFILDEDDIIHHASINNLPIGRNVTELLRLVQAIKAHKKNGQVCPANWTKNDQMLQPTDEGVKAYFVKKEI